MNLRPVVHPGLFDTSLLLRNRIHHFKKWRHKETDNTESNHDPLPEETGHFRKKAVSGRRSTVRRPNEPSVPTRETALCGHLRIEGRTDRAGRARDRDSQDSAFRSASGWASGVGADPKKRHLKTPLKPPGRSSPQGNMDGDTEDNCHRKPWLRRGRTCNTLVTDTPVPPTRARGSDGSKRSETDHLFSVSDVLGSMLNT